MAQSCTAVTGSVTNITKTTATCGGQITFLGTFGYDERGIAYGLTSNPFFGGGQRVAAPGIGDTTPYTCELTGLTANTLYHYQAYGAKSGTNGIGADLTFTTSSSSGQKLVTLGINRTKLNGKIIGLTT